jgi:hypothetical protein
VVGVDQLGQLGLAGAGGHRQRGDSDGVPDPHARVAGEKQVRQRVDQEVLVLQQRRHQSAGPDLVVADAGHQGLGQVRRSQRLQVVGEVCAQGVAQPQVPGDVGDRLGAGFLAGERLGQEFAEIQHLDTAVAQGLCEAVVLVLGPAHPGDPVEQQFVVVARREPPKLVAGPVQHHRPQRSDLAVHSVPGCPDGVRVHLAVLSPGAATKLRRRTPYRMLSDCPTILPTITWKVPGAEAPGRVAKGRRGTRLACCVG